MTTRSEGVRRLSLLLGLAGALLGCLVSLVQWQDLARRKARVEDRNFTIREQFEALSAGVEHTPPKPPGFAEYLPIAVIPVVAFLIPWGGIRVIAWVIEGFLVDRKRNGGMQIDSEVADPPADRHHDGATGRTRNRSERSTSV